MSPSIRPIDAHAHLHLREGVTQQLVALMDAYNIEQTVVVAGGTITPDLLSQRLLNTR